MSVATTEASAGPILLFGMPRSGTTWIGKIFDSHPDTVYKHEPDSFKKILDVPILPPAAEHGRYRDAILRYVEGIPGVRSSKVCGKRPLFAKSYFGRVRLQTMSAGVAAAGIASRVGLEIPVIGSPSRIPDGARLLWKSIESIGRLRLVAATLQDARLVHLMRHPCGYVASVQRGEAGRRFEDNRGASEDYGILDMLLGTELAGKRGLSLDYFRSLEPVERLAWRWVLFNDEACIAAAENSNCRTVRYEDVCAEPIESVANMFDFAGLPSSAQTREFLEASTATEQDSYYSVYKNPSVAANKWRKELSSSDVRKVRAIVEPTTPGKCYADDW